MKEKYLRYACRSLIPAIALLGYALGVARNVAPRTADNEGPAPRHYLPRTADRGPGDLQLIVELTEPSVIESFVGRADRASARGRVAEEPLTRVDLGSPRARALRSRISEVQKEAAARLLGLPGIQVEGTLDTVMNAVIVRVPARHIASVRRLTGVRKVYLSRERKPALDTSASLQNAQALWNRVGGREGAGRGVKIGVIDTGIDISNPMFSGLSFASPAGYPKGETAFTNNKVIVARNYISLLARRQSVQTAVDEVGHGSFVAACAAGNQYSAPLAVISGMAPGAWLGSYKVFGTPGINDTATSAAILSALDDAVADGMDVVNLSLGSLSYVPASEDPEVQALNNAVAAGVTIVMAAGNEGPGTGTISNPGSAADVIAVGAVTNSRGFAALLRVTAPAPVPVDLQGIAYQPGDGPSVTTKIAALPVADVATLDGDGLACSSFPAAGLAGRIAFLSRGTCFFETKVTNVAAAGAVAAVVYNNVPGADAITMGGLGATSIPAVMISNPDGLALKSFLAANSGSAMVEIDDSETLQPTSTTAGVMADFSSRGPTVDFVLKPDIVAVGVNVYSAAQSTNIGGDLYSSTGFTVADGTSFSTAMVSGAAAAVKQLFPALSPPALKSLVVNTAARNLTLDGVRQADILRAGSGLLDMGNAAAAGAWFSPSSLSFGAAGYSGGTTLSRNFVINNISAAPDSFSLTVEPIVSGPAITLSSATTGSIPSGGTWGVEMTVSATEPMSGGFQGFLRIESQRTGRVYRIPYWAGLYAADTSSILRVRLTPGDGEFGSLSEALKAARPGNVIEFQDSGTYSAGQTVMLNDEGLPLHGITIRAAQGQTPVLDASGVDAPAGLWVIGLQNVLIQRLNITGGQAGILLTQPSSSVPLSAAIDNCTISNPGGDGGDGVVIESGGTVDITKSLVSGFSGTGILAYGRAQISVSGTTVQGNGSDGIDAFDSNLLILNSTFSGNSGPGAYLDGCSGTVEGSTFAQNLGSFGDGLEVVGGDFTIRNNTFEANDRSGIGMFAGTAGGPGPAARIENNIVRLNQRYGILANPGGTLTLDGNFVSANGRGVRLAGFTTGLLVNNIIAGSTDPGNGDGLQAANSGAVRLVNNTFYRNSLRAIQAGGSASVTAANCIFSGDGSGELSGLLSGEVQFCLVGDGTFAGVNHNVSGDPGFVDPDAGRFDLAPGSPALDAGDNAAPDLPFLDHDRRLRVAGGGIVDMGALETDSTYPMLFPFLANGFEPVLGDTLTTGFAVLNSSSEAAPVDFTAYGNGGGLVDGALNPANRWIAPGEQIPILGFQLFGFENQAGQQGSVLASSLQKLAGFFLVFDDEFKRLADGVNVTGEAGTSFLFMRHEADDAGKSVYSIFNPGVTPAAVTATLIDKAGNQEESSSAVLPPKGNALLSFSASGNASAGYVQVEADRPVTGLEFYGNSAEIAALGAAFPGTDARLFFPHIAVNQGFTTTIGIVNPGSSPAALTLKLCRDDGALRRAPVSVVLAGGAQLLEPLSSLFSLDSQELITGYVIVESSEPGIRGFIEFRYDNGAAHSFAAVPAQAAPRQTLLFSHVAHGVPAGSGDYQTGIALLNPYGTPVTFTIHVFNGSGVQVAEMTDILGPRSKVARMLSHPVAGAGFFTRQITLGSGYIEVSSDYELLGFELFFTEEFSLLAAVPAQF